MDLISREAAIDVLINEFHGMISDESMRIYQIISWLSTLPTAEPEIVRCKECKWSYDDVSGRICSYGVCVDCAVSDDFYCADAERRTEETDEEAYEKALEEFRKNPKTYTLDEVEASLGLTAEKRGKWEIDVDCEYDIFDIEGERTWAVKATCSECGFAMRFIEGHGMFNYCPNCGADMRGQANEMG